MTKLWGKFINRIKIFIKMRTNIFFLIVFFSLLIISCKNKNASTEENGDKEEILPPNTVEMNDAQYKTAGIELGQVEYKVLSNVLKVNGIVNVPPQNLVSVSVNMGGFVKSTDLVQGSPVSKGQVLAVIENPEFIELQQNYLESKNKLEFAEADYNRQKDLYKENVSSEKTYQQALSEYKSLKTRMFALEQKLILIGIDTKQLTEEKISRSVSVVASISGYIKTVNINIGKYVNPTDVMFEIVNNQKLTLELSLFEKDIASVSIGQKIRFSLPDNSIEQSAVIYQVGKTIGDDKTVKVYAAVNNEDKNLLPGMYVNAFIEISNDSTTSLPEEAVLTFDDKNYFFIFSEQKKEDGNNISLFMMIEVKKGISNNGFTEVILPKDFDIKKSKVVIKGAYNLLSAMKNAGDMAC
ncbi:MAG: efflux transporter periplasmic adaptor subunit [Bacteroidetes bacterium CG_4_10_14_3_um_filter_31_20]|nr:MAG: efflux transporter periplasmic adaptor subunit [Bacteroidetes bacterium CG_4_8_14_3_um_filter_31_14]PIY03450.1 MAG: efflux transporter periplasmic adaptor subunit [Bacteroidetes bacterium CG_4_10_14_3_um_filter_31_20]